MRSTTSGPLGGAGGRRAYPSPAEVVCMLTICDAFECISRSHHPSGAKAGAEYNHMVSIWSKEGLYNGCGRLPRHSTSPLPNVSLSVRAKQGAQRACPEQRNMCAHTVPKCPPPKHAHALYVRPRLQSLQCAMLLRSTWLYNCSAFVSNVPRLGCRPPRPKVASRTKLFHTM